MADLIHHLFATRGGSRYMIDEPITQWEHAYQTYYAMKLRTQRHAMHVAALLHDIGHLLQDPVDPSQGVDDMHEAKGARWLQSQGFPKTVWRPVQLHVQAKRYLRYRDPSRVLSHGSELSLALQGGPMSPEEALVFEHDPFFQDALLLRECDDIGKDLHCTVPDQAWVWLRDLIQNTQKKEMSVTITYPVQKFYKGKVRDVYTLDDNQLLMVASDRISAFDVVLKQEIPFKGQVLNQIAAHNLAATSDIVPNWLRIMPGPNLSGGVACKALPFEMIVRSYMVGHVWREYRKGARSICGVPLAEGYKENDPFPNPILTPTSKAAQGEKDEDMSREEIIAKGWVNRDEYQLIESYARALFARGTIMAHDRGLILLDSKFEFGRAPDGRIILIDECLTPDSSRYWVKPEEKDAAPKQLSKEFVREWIIKNTTDGKEPSRDNIPDLPATVVEEVSQRYMELYERMLGKPFVKQVNTDVNAHM